MKYEGEIHYCEDRRCWGSYYYDPDSETWGFLRVYVYEDKQDLFEPYFTLMVTEEAKDE